MRVTVSTTTARRVLALLDMYETPERAAHELYLGARAIEPYTDQRSERVRGVLLRLARATELGMGPEWCAKLTEIAAEGPREG